MSYDFGIKQKDIDAGSFEQEQAREKYVYYATSKVDPTKPGFWYLKQSDFPEPPDDSWTEDVYTFNDDDLWVSSVLRACPAIERQRTHVKDTVTDRVYFYNQFTPYDSIRSQHSNAIRIRRQVHIKVYMPVLGPDLSNMPTMNLLGPARTVSWKNDRNNMFFYEAMPEGAFQDIQNEIAKAKEASGVRYPEWGFWLADFRGRYEKKGKKVLPMWLQLGQGTQSSSINPFMADMRVKADVPEKQEKLFPEMRFIGTEMHNALTMWRATQGKAWVDSWKSFGSSTIEDPGDGEPPAQSGNNVHWESGAAAQEDDLDSIPF